MFKVSKNSRCVFSVINAVVHFYHYLKKIKKIHNELHICENYYFTKQNILVLSLFRDLYQVFVCPSLVYRRKYEDDLLVVG